jgi:drug/metabolite transporter (DMT)-like permease
MLLIIATVLSASFGLVLRYGQGRKLNLWAMGALNYVTASLFNIGCALIGGNAAPSLPTWEIGLLGGVCFVTSYLLFFPMIALRGVSITTAVVRLSALIPVLVAILFWGEHPAGYQVVGATMALASLPLLGFKPSDSNGERLPRRTIGLLAALFVMNGLCLLAVRGYKQTAIVGQNSWFLGILFGVAAVISTAAWLRHRAGSSPRDLVPGIGLGMINALANLALVAALDQVPAAVAYPFQAAVGLVIVAIFARLVWDERITPLETAGMAIAVAAVVFINLG